MQQELKSLDPCTQQSQVRQVKQLLVQSVKDLNHKRMQFNEIFYQVLSDGARWLEHSRGKELGEKLAERKSFEGFKPAIKQRASYQLKSQKNLQTNLNLQKNRQYESTSKVDRTTRKTTPQDIKKIIDQCAVDRSRQLFEVDESDQPGGTSRQSHSVQPKVRQQNFLKKGDKSRVYDPKEAIKMHKKQAAEYNSKPAEGNGVDELALTG